MKDLPKTDTNHEVFDFRKQSSVNTPLCAPYTLERPVFFVGFMGAGKTSVARKVARLAQLSSIDVDSYIERRSEKCIKDIFAESGEDGFRDIETKILRELAEGTPQVIACGGGIVLREENRHILREQGYVVYLQVTAEEAASRISDTSTRPLFGNLNQAQRVITERLPLYEEVADACIDTNQRSTNSLAHEIVNTLKREGILWQQK